MTLYDYRLSVINELLPENNTSVVAGSSRVRNSRGEVHKISKIIERNAKGFLKRKMCRVCSKTQKKNKKTLCGIAKCVMPNLVYATNVSMNITCPSKFNFIVFI